METSQYQWQRLFVAALTERNAEKFMVRLTAADDAIFNRLLELENLRDDAATETERTALEDSLQDLRLLRNDCYHFRV